MKAYDIFANGMVDGTMYSINGVPIVGMEMKMFDYLYRLEGSDTSIRVPGWHDLDVEVYAD